jgi:hypothetical protein
MTDDRRVILSSVVDIGSVDKVEGWMKPLG